MHLFFECPFDPTLLAHYKHKLEPAITAVRHVDHKLNSPRPPCTRPTLVYKGRSDPTEGEDEQKQNKSFVLATNNSSSAPRADPPQEECQELLPSFHHLLPLRRGRDLTANEPRINTEWSLTKSLLHSVVTLSILGTLECKDHQTTGRRAPIAWTRINRCVLCVFLSPPKPLETHT
jgi:hypothetical protein